MRFFLSITSFYWHVFCYVFGCRQLDILTFFAFLSNIIHTLFFVLFISFNFSRLCDLLFFFTVKINNRSYVFISQKYQFWFQFSDQHLEIVRIKSNDFLLASIRNVHIVYYNKPTCFFVSSDTTDALNTLMFVHSSLLFISWSFC